MSDKPTVSAIITTCNRSDVVANAINSVLEQTYKCCEIIIVDDCSDDLTQEIVSQFVDNFDNIIYERLSVRSGACKARNRGREIATGDLIAGLDDDDEWLPNRIEVLVLAYKPSFSFVTSQDIYINNHERWLSEKPKKVTFDNLLYDNCVGNQVLVSKLKLDELNGFDETLPSAQDYDMWIRLVEKFGPALVVESATQLVYMTDNPGRITNSRKKITGYFIAYVKHKNLMSKDQRKYQLAKLYQHKNKQPNLRIGFTLWSFKEKYRWPIYYLKQLPMLSFVRHGLRLVRKSLK